MKYPDWLRYGNLGLAFLLEVAALLCFAAAGALVPAGWMQLVVGILGAIAFFVLWGLFAAPKSKRRLRGTRLLAFKAAIFAVAVAILFALGLTILAVVLALLVVLNLFLGRQLRQA